MIRLLRQPSQTLVRWLANVDSSARVDVLSYGPQTAGCVQAQVLELRLFLVCFVEPTNTSSCARRVVSATETGYTGRWSSSAGGFFCTFSAQSLSPSDVTLPCSVGVSRAQGRCLSCQLRLGTSFSGPEHELTHHSRRVTVRVDLSAESEPDGESRWELRQQCLIT